MKELIDIQTELNAPKTKFNQFFRGTYRSAEDIMQAIKPLLKSYRCYLNCTDEICLIGDRFFVKATASLTNESGERESASAYAELRTPGASDKLDPAQMTGSASSYARKYALGGLLALDDNKDPDDPESPHYKTENQQVTSAKKPAAKKLSPEKYRKLVEMAANGETIEGQDARDWYEINCEPGATAMKLFDKEVGALKEQKTADPFEEAAKMLDASDMNLI